MCGIGVDVVPIPTPTTPIPNYRCMVRCFQLSSGLSRICWDW